MIHSRPEPIANTACSKEDEYWEVDGHGEDIANPSAQIWQAVMEAEDHEKCEKSETVKLREIRPLEALFHLIGAWICIW